jgi:hypothetical protein
MKHIFFLCFYGTINFDMWMSKGAHDVFALVKRNLDLIGNQNK